MAKSKQKTDIYDEMVEIMVKAAADSGMFLGAYDELQLRGIPIPPLCLQWLINSNVWPLGRITSCAGLPKTNKSTFAYQLAKWFIEAGGIATLIDTENKAAADVLQGIIGSIPADREMLRKRCRQSTATSMEQWQGNLLKQANELKNRFKRADDCPMPFLNIIDSLTGVNSEAGTDELIANEGGVAQSRVGQQSAKALFQFMRDGSRRSLESSEGGPTASRWPVTLHTVSHQRKRGDGFAGYERSGGISPDFYTSLDLVFTRGGTSSYNMKDAKEPGAGKEGRIITISVRYSSLGPDGKNQSISVPVLGEWVVKDGRKQNILSFDWGAADTHFLMKNYKKFDLAPILQLDMSGKDPDYKYVKGHGERVRCKLLGHKKHVSASDFGIQLQHNVELWSQVQDAIGIPQRDTFIYLDGMITQDTTLVQPEEADLEDKEGEE